MRAYLSYPLEDASVVWPGEPTVQIRRDTCIEEQGYTSFKTLLPNHHGTHCDGPRHFNPNGPGLTELGLEWFCYDHVAAADVPMETGRGVAPEDLRPYEESIRGAELLLIKTGFCLRRDTDPRTYESLGPYLTPEACRYLVENFPDLKAVGLDFLSVGTPANRLSRLAHQTLFGCLGGRFILAIEDMDLRPLFQTGKTPDRVLALPLRLVGVDSSQVTVVGEFQD